MSKDHGSDFGKISGALLFGVAAGAVIGFLTAPKKGTQTQKDLQKKVKAWMHDFEDGKIDLGDKLHKIFGLVSKETSEIYGRVKAEAMTTIHAKGKNLLPADYEKTADKLIKKYQKQFKLAADVAQKLKDDVVDGMKASKK